MVGAVTCRPFQLFSRFPNYHENFKDSLERLEKVAKEKGYNNVDDYVEDEVKRVESQISDDDLHKEVKRVTEKLKRIASEKGFKSIEAYKQHVVRQIPPDSCGIKYKIFLECSRDFGGGSRYCADLRNKLSSQCGAVWNGTSLHYPGRSKIEKYLNIEPKRQGGMQVGADSKGYD